MKREVFTSGLLIISPNKELEQRLMDKSWSVESYIEGNFSFFHDSRVKRGEVIFPSSLSPEYAEKIKEYSDEFHEGVLDLTSCLKGEFMYRLLEGEEVEDDFLINFGGDIVGRGSYDLMIETSFTRLSEKGWFAIFTSGNTDRRGHHIMCKIPRSGTVTSVFKNFKISDLTNFDCYNTLRYAGEVEQMKGVTEFWVEDGVTTVFLGDAES